MKTKLIFILTAILAGTALMAQNIQEGINNLYAERYKSAKTVFEKLVAANPNNLEATYWLGQANLALKDVPAARSVYEKALQANGNAPLLLVGMGHVELYENKTNEARQRFETAISLSRGKKGDDPNVLNAIGRANVDAKAGDLAYAIEKLKLAATRDEKNPDIYLNLGNAYRKAHDGSNAVVSYNKALEINPNFAIASFRKGKIWETQKNWEPYEMDMNAAITKDPKFAPGYYELYYYNLGKLNFTAANDYAAKFISNTDPDPQNDYLRIQTLYAQKKYDEAIAGAKALISTAGAQTKPRTYRLLAYSYVAKGDSVGARQYIDEFFAKADEEEVIGQDYILQADIYAGLPDNPNPNIVRDSYLKAAAMDSVLEKQVKFLQEGIDRFKASGKRIAEGDLRLALYNLKPNPHPSELISIGLPYYYGLSFQKADSLFSLYSKAFPDSVYGYLWSSRALAQMDTAMELGLAVPAYQQLLRVAELNKEKFKSYGIQASGYLAGYYNNIKKDKDSAIVYLERGLVFDPTNAAIQKNLDILKGAPKTPSKSTTPANRPTGALNTSGGGNKESTVKK